MQMWYGRGSRSSCLQELPLTVTSLSLYIHNAEPYCLGAEGTLYHRCWSNRDISVHRACDSCAIMPATGQEQ